MYYPIKRLLYAPISGNTTEYYKRSKQVLLFSMLTFATMAGMRFHTGVDHLSYLQDYLYAGRGISWNDNMEPLYVFITKIMAKAGFHYIFYFGLLAFVQVFFVYKSAENRVYLIPYFALLLVLGPYFMDFANGIRQNIVCCVLLFAASKFIVGNKYLIYILCVLLCTTMHSSALILLPFVLLSLYIPVFGNKWVNLTIVMACVILGNSQFWIGGLEYISKVLTFMNFEKYSHDLEIYMEGDMGREVSFGPLRMSALLLNITIIWFYKPMRSYYNNDKYLDLSFFLFFLGVCMYNLFTNAGLLFMRVAMYFTIFTLPMTAYLLHYLRNNTKHSVYVIILLLAMTYSSMNALKYSMISNRTYVEEANLYKFFFMHDESEVKPLM